MILTNPRFARAVMAHGWQGFNERIQIRWAQEMNQLQEQVNQRPKSIHTDVMEEQLCNLQVMGATSSVPLNGSDRAYIALAALFAILGTMLGWMARAELRKDPPAQRGLALAQVATLFWPVAAVPLLVLILA